MRESWWRAAIGAVAGAGVFVFACAVAIVADRWSHIRVDRVCDIAPDGRAVLFGRDLEGAVVSLPMTVEGHCEFAECEIRLPKYMTPGTYDLRIKNAHGVIEVPIVVGPGGTR